MSKVSILNTSAEKITVSKDGDSHVMDKDSVEIKLHPDTRKSTVIVYGVENGKTIEIEFALSEVQLPAAQASKAALIATVEGYINGVPSMEVFTPLTGTTSAPTATKAREMVIIVKPAGTIAAHTVTMPALYDGQKLTLISTQVITSWTITPNGTSTIQNAPTAGTTTFTRSWIYNAAQDTLFLV